MIPDSLIFVLPAETLSEDEEDIPCNSGDGIGIGSCPDYTSAGSEFVPTPGGPFSALTPSMWPQDILHRLSHPVNTLR